MTTLNRFDSVTAVIQDIKRFKTRSAEYLYAFFITMRLVTWIIPTLVLKGEQHNEAISHYHGRLIGAH